MRSTYEFFDDALVDQDRYGDSEEADEGEVAAAPPEVVLQILPSRTPFLDPLVLVSFHSSTHFLSFFFNSGFSLLSSQK